MATRSERVDEALEITAGHEDILELLALNEIPLRRGYFCAVTGLDGNKVVKILAKLANASMLEETDGLLFRVVTPEEATEIRTRIPPERVKQHHEDSLAWAAAEEEPDPRFMLGHLLGAERHEDAARMAMDLLESETDAFRARAWTARLKTALNAMLDTEGHDPEFVRKVGVALIERSGKEMKSRELTRLNSRLKEVAVSEDDHLLFDSLVEQAKLARASETAARKEAEKAAEAAAAADAEQAEGASGTTGAN